ncbi:MAG: cyclic nucleotide-binding domain-containing protein [Polyangiaceae bacterium]
MGDDLATRRVVPLGPEGTAVMRKESCAAEGDTLVLDVEPAESVRLVPAEPAPHTLRSPAVPSTPEERFEEQGEIGRGGMGSVHRVFDRAILRTVAEKRLHDSVRMLPGAAARFLEEAQITGQLDHPNIVPVHDIGVDDGGAVTRFSMKLVRGKTLKELVGQAHADGLGGARIEALLQIFLKLCDAVAFAHSRGVIHRDLKPDNVMVGSHGQVYLMDWGIARLKGGSRPSDLHVNGQALGNLGPIQSERSRAVVGTPAYMAPEQAEGRLDDIDERTDVFGLGAILYRILTNQAPHAAKSSEEAILRSLAGEVTPPDQVVTEMRLPPGLCRIAMTALAKEPANRYQNVELLQRAVFDFLHGGGWFRTLELGAGTIIVREGERPDAAYIITSGHCEAYTGAGGEKRSLRVMGPGEAFGETSIFTDQPRTASVVALDDVEVMEITLDALEQECGRRSWMRTFVTALAQRFLDAHRELDELRRGSE